MTHTLHRIKSETNKYNDYVVLIMPARGINNENSVEIFKKYIDIMAKFNPINMGGIGLGNMELNTVEELKENIPSDAPMIHGVFGDRKTLIEVMKALKKADYGYSVVVSGLLDDVDSCTKSVRIQRHSCNISLGVWGDLDKLPPQQVIEITTMCGHAMISSNLVLSMVDKIKKGIITSEKAASELSKPCACGIFNTKKAKNLLDELANNM